MASFDRLLTVMTKPWVIISYIILIVLSFFYFDVPIATYFYHLNLRDNLPLLKWLTLLGFNGLYVVGLFILALVFRYIIRNKTWEIRTWFLWLCVCFTNIICLVLKILLSRARPDLLFTEHQYGFYGLKTRSDYWSFPSGHTTTVMSFAFGLSILFPRYCYAFIVAGLVVVLSRILLVQHYLADVLIAAYLALLEVGLLHWWLRKKNFFK